jgi:glycosyltransferase involved in cell wall biosynthesis
MTERPIRVAYLVRYLPSISETFILDEAAALAEAGADVEVWALERDLCAVEHGRHRGTYERAEIVPRGSSLRAILAAAVLRETPAFAGARVSWAGEGRPKDLRRVAWLARTWRKRGIDVVRVHHAAETARFAIAAGGLVGIPVAVAVHARDLFVPVPDLSWILRTASLVTTITPFHRDLLLRSGLPSQQVVLLRCAVDLPADVARSPQPGSPLRLLSVGRLIEKKGHDLLLEACAVLAGEGTPIEVVVVGEGAERLRLEELCDQLQRRHGDMLQVELLGGLPVEEVQALLSEGEFHAAVLACRVTSEGDRDGVPVALMEAQSYGVPVVSSALPGFDYEFTDGAGAVLVSLQDMGDGVEEPVQSEFVRALAELYRDPKYRQLMADGARFSSGRRPPPADVGGALLKMLLPLCSNIPSA